VNDTAGTSHETIVPVGLTNVVMSEGEEQFYLYNFDEIAAEVNALTSQGWSVSDAVYYVMSNLDSDGDGVPDSIDATPYPKAMVSLSLSSAEISQGKTLTITGSMTPQMSGTIINLTYTQPGGSTVNRTATTSMDGSFTDTYSPDTLGPWTVQASWNKMLTSAIQSFSVQQSGCFIATATYGSELSPEVQFLRGFRENQVKTTFTGRQFISTFNSIYYTFSPAVASAIVNNDPLRKVMKGVLQPLMIVLHAGVDVYTTFSVLPDMGIVMFSLVVSSLLSLIYLVPWALLITFLRKKPISSKMSQRVTLMWISSIIAIILAEMTQSPALMMTSGTILVTTTAGLTIVSVNKVITRFMNR